MKDKDVQATIEKLQDEMAALEELNMHGCIESILEIQKEIDTLKNQGRNKEN